MAEKKNTGILVSTAYGPKDMTEVTAQLAEPFSLNDVEWRVGSTNKDKTKGIALPYITNRAVQERLDQVMGIGFWRNGFEPWRNRGVLCGLALKINDEWIIKYDGADESDVEATKGGMSDAMKRAAYQWGIGRYLYDLPQFWVDLEQRGNSYVIKGEPPVEKFPEWAIRADELAKWKEYKSKRNGGNAGGSSTGNGQGGAGSTSRSGGAGGNTQPSGLGLPGKTGGHATNTEAPAAGAKSEGDASSRNGSAAGANGVPALTFKVKAAPTTERATSGPNKGKDYILVRAEDAQGNECRLVGFEKAAIDALKALSVGAEFTDNFVEVGNTAKGKIYEMVSLVEQAS